MNTTIQFVTLTIYAILPGAFANMMPVFARRINFLNTPIDFNKMFNGKSIFGSHKTYRGFFFGILGAILIAYIQKLLYQYPTFQQISFFNFNETSFLLIGFLMGFGVLFGDLVESFFKRRVGIKPGAVWFPWDQTDAVIGGLLFVSIIKVPTWQMVVFLLIAGPIIHVSTNHLGYWLKIKETKW
jgi:CDP-2,3-bis-(O-geranylgeranyl)-sn-glycerol synthase